MKASCNNHVALFLGVLISLIVSLILGACGQENTPQAFSTVSISSSVILNKSQRKELEELSKDLDKLRTGTKWIGRADAATKKVKSVLNSIPTPALSRVLKLVSAKSQIAFMSKLNSKIDCVLGNNLVRVGCVVEVITDFVNDRAKQVDTELEVATKALDQFLKEDTSTSRAVNAGKALASLEIAFQGLYDEAAEFETSINALIDDFLPKAAEKPTEKALGWLVDAYQRPIEKQIKQINSSNVLLSSLAVRTSRTNSFLAA
jgi:hypothetical protein